MSRDKNKRRGVIDRLSQVWQWSSRYPNIRLAVLGMALIVLNPLTGFTTLIQWSWEMLPPGELRDYYPVWFGPLSPFGKLWSWRWLHDSPLMTGLALIAVALVRACWQSDLKTGLKPFRLQRPPRDVR